MQDKHFQMIELYIERERIKHYHEIEICKQMVLEDFFCYYEDTRGEDYDLSEITEFERNEYFRYLSKDRSVVFSREAERTIKGFLEFITKIGFITKSPGEGDE